MREVVIVSAVRTPGGKAKKGSFYDVRPEFLGKLCMEEAVKRANIEAYEIDDVVWGCATPEQATGMNTARMTAMYAGIPETVPGVTINRFCSSGLQAIAFGAESIISGRCDVVLSGGVEYMSMGGMGGVLRPNPDIISTPGIADLYIGMGRTAENIAMRYSVSREDQDAFAVSSHQKAVAAITAGRFNDEIVPVPVKKTVLDAKGTRVTTESVVREDEGVRTDASVAGLAKLPATFSVKGSVTAGNSSQMTDGAAAVILMEAGKAAKAGLKPLGKFLGYAVVGCKPDEMGVGPVYAIPKVLKQVGLSLHDIGLIELNEAFASQALYCMRKLDINQDIVNVNGGAIAIGHPMGATGAKLTATLLNEMRRRSVKYGMVTMCIGGGQGAAGIYELCE